MAKINSYPSGTLNLTDYFIGTDRDNDNVTRSYKVSEVINTIIAAAPGSIGTVTSISTVSSNYINVTGGPITVTGTVTAALSATGTPSGTTFLTGDDTWSLPGPTPSTVAILYNGTQLTADANSMDYTGNVTATAAGLSTTVNMPGQNILVDSVIAGTAISVSAPTGNVTITNTGVTLARAGGNVTLSGGTGDVTVSTTANPGTISNVAPGLGVATIINSSSNPEIDLEFTGVNNYISRSLDITTSLPEDLVEFNDLSGSVVKNVEIGDIPPAILTAVKTYIDDEDKNKLKNTTDTYTSTEKALNMVSLTASEYLVLQSGGILDENTLYFIIGAGVAYTANATPTDNISGGTLNVDYTFSTTPLTATGVVGASYTFTTTVNPIGGSITITNNSVTDNIINPTPLSSPYNKSYLVSGTFTPSPVIIYQAQLAITLQAGSSGTSIAVAGLNTIWRYVVGNSSPGSINPYPANTSSSYTFNAEIEIMDPDYEFVSTPEYELTEGSGSFQTGATSFTGSVSSVYPPAQVVTQKIKAGYALKTFSYGLTTTNDLTDSNGVVGGGSGVEYNLSFTGISSGTYSINTSITGVWTASAIYPFQFVGGATAVTAAVTGGTLPFYLTGNSTRTLTLTGTLEDTTPLTAKMILVYVNGITGGTAGTQYTLNPTANDVGNGNIEVEVAEGSAYSVLPSPPITATPATGYYFSSAFSATQTGGSNPLSGTMPAAATSPHYASQTLAGTIAASKATVTVNCAAVPFSTSITYQTSFAPGSAATRTLTTTNTQTATNTNFSVGDGIVVVTISRTSPSSTSEDAGSILWSLNGVAQGSPSPLIFSSGTTISYSRTISGVSHGDTILVSIAEG